MLHLCEKGIEGDLKPINDGRSCGDPENRAVVAEGLAVLIHGVELGNAGVDEMDVVAVPQIVRKSPCALSLDRVPQQSQRVGLSDVLDLIPVLVR